MAALGAARPKGETAEAKRERKDAAKGLKQVLLHPLVHLATPPVDGRPNSYCLPLVYLPLTTHDYYLPPTHYTLLCYPRRGGTRRSRRRLPSRARTSSRTTRTCAPSSRPPAPCEEAEG